jgi:sarcosine oxidase
MTSFDVIVAGVGAHGSATVHELAARGQRVLGLERSNVPNTTGSSGGVNRIIRLAYNEDPRYVPLLRRAYERWRALEERWGRQLLVITGGLDIGPPDSAVVQGAMEACRVHDLPHEVLDGRTTRARYPGLAIPDAHLAVHQPDAGFVMSEEAIAAHAMLALSDGAEIHGDEPVIDWEPDGDGVIVRTERAEYRAGRLVLTAGAWMSRLAAPLRDLAVPERQVLVWVAPRRPELFQVGALPVFILEEDDGTEWYVFPEYGIPGVKVGLYHHRGEVIDPDRTDWRVIQPEDEGALRGGIERFMPLANGPLLSWRACIFTNTPDEHFILDRYPGYPQVILASPCSGHGYKFASVIGEVLADMAMDREPTFDLSMFRLDRFGAPSAAR